jgi:hypothetical protein
MRTIGRTKTVRVRTRQSASRPAHLVDSLMLQWMGTESSAPSTTVKSASVGSYNTVHTHVTVCTLPVP